MASILDQIGPAQTGSGESTSTPGKTKAPKRGPKKRIKSVRKAKAIGKVDTKHPKVKKSQITAGKQKPVKSPPSKKEPIKREPPNIPGWRRP
tara:strand:- start:176 stop:451 length:276 start_codon:yes stop_codon:yes gene_type:complete